MRTLVKLLAIAILWLDPGVVHAKSRGCHCCSDSYVASVIQPTVTLSNFNVTESLGTGSLLLEKNRMLYVIRTLTSPIETFYIPVYQWGDTSLLFFRNPQPGQVLGGWTSAAIASSASILQAWLSCNRLPRLSSSQKRQILDLYLPNVCCNNGCCP